MFKKNTAVTGFALGLVSATDGSAITSGTVTGYVTLDGGTQATIAGTITHEGNGQWSVDLTTGEMNGDIVGLLFTHSTAINAHFTIATDTVITSEVGTTVDAILVDTSTTLNDKIDVIDGIVDAILVDTSTTLDTKINTIDTNVDAILVDTSTTLNDKIDVIDGIVDTILVDTADMQPKIGTPATDVSADIAAVKVDTAAVLVDTADMQPKIGTPATDVSADIAAVKVDTAATVVDTVDIQGRLPAALSSGNMKSDVLAISTSTEAADNLEASAEVIVSGTVEAGTLSTTVMTTNLSQATDDHYNGRIIIWVDGALQDQATDITDYSGTAGTLTFTAVTSVPVAGTKFIIV